MPLAEGALVITGTGGTTVRVKLDVPVPPWFVALMVAELVPVADGVPEMRPVEEFTLKPAGRPLAP